jgi:hypothetical protein
MSEQSGAYPQGRGLTERAARKPSLWQRLRTAPVLGTSIGMVQAGQKKLWFEIVGQVTAMGTVAGLTLTAVNHLPPTAQQVALAMVATGVPAGALGSSLSESLKTGWDLWRKNHQARKTAPPQQPVAEGARIVALEERMAKLEAANTDLRLNNAAVLADHALLREQNTALQQSNHSVRTQNVSLHQENSELRQANAALTNSLDRLYEVVDAHAHIVKNQKVQLDSHDEALKTQGKSLVRHETMLAGHGEALFTHEESLKRLRQQPAGYVETSQVQALNARANETLVNAKQRPAEEQQTPGVDPGYYPNPNVDPGHDPTR